MDNLIGKKLDGLYEVKELIGSGGMANVYKAVMLGRNGPVPAGTVVAVKVLRQEYTHDPELVRRFKNESKAISLLNHPNIVKVYDVSVNDQLQYIVMEYVDGMTLREYLNERGGKLTSRETVHFISQILKALEHAHANGVVHRDIKPQNIMLLDNGQLRMMDFGIARISRAENQLLSGKTMGSVHYISPEQAKGDETDCTSDIYSVGVMMYEMLSGQLPFDAEDAVEVAIKQISDQPKSLHEIAPQVPAALVEITEKAMETYDESEQSCPPEPSERVGCPARQKGKAQAPVGVPAGPVRHHDRFCTGLFGPVLADPERLVQPDEQQGRYHPERLHRHDSGGSPGHRAGGFRPDQRDLGAGIQQQLCGRLYLQTVAGVRPHRA